MEHYGGVLRSLHWDVVKTSYFNAQRTSVEDVGMGRSLALLHRGPYGEVIWGHPQDIFSQELKRTEQMTPCTMA